MKAKLWIVFENNTPQSVFSKKRTACRELCNHIFFRFSWSNDKEFVELYEAGKFEEAAQRGSVLAGHNFHVQGEDIVIDAGMRMCPVTNGIDESDYVE